jgi:arginine decarboxylase
MNQQILLPSYKGEEEEPLYLGFFHTGAYQDAISGYGGIKHCLIPSPKQIIIDRMKKEISLTDYIGMNKMLSKCFRFWVMMNDNSYIFLS